jgi:hypothetical protein
MVKPKRKLTAEQRRARKKHRAAFMTVFINGKQKSVSRRRETNGFPQALVLPARAATGCPSSAGIGVQVVEGAFRNFQILIGAEAEEFGGLRVILPAAFPYGVQHYLIRLAIGWEVALRVFEQVMISGPQSRNNMLVD